MLCSNGIVIAKHIFFYQVCWIVRPEAAFMAAHGNPCLDHILISRNSCFIPPKLIKQGFSGKWDSRAIG